MAATESGLSTTLSSSGASARTELVGPGTTLADERLLPVVPALQPLLPGGGLRRGTPVAVTRSAALALALVAGASAAGSWVAAVGLPDLGILAAAETGIALERLALVPTPGSAGPGSPPRPAAPPPASAGPSSGSPARTAPSPRRARRRVWTAGPRGCRWPMPGDR